MTVWRGTDGDTAPVAVECQAFGHPNLDSDGRMMFENTHFRTEAEAWQSILSNVDDAVSLTGRRVAELRSALAKYESIAAKAAADYATAHDGFKALLRKETEGRNG